MGGMPTRPNLASTVSAEQRATVESGLDLLPTRGGRDVESAVAGVGEMEMQRRRTATVATDLATPALVREGPFLESEVPPVGSEATLPPLIEFAHSPVLHRLQRVSSKRFITDEGIGMLNTYVANVSAKSSRTFVAA